jgi:hypothetical protein
VQYTLVGIHRERLVETTMVNLQTSWTEHELLADEPGLEPLIVDGHRCHGGFDANGDYVSPRSRFRQPAIAHWQAQHRQDFGTELLDAGLDTWPPASPNVGQSRFLLSEGVREPVIAALTRIGTVEGFGGAMRTWHAGDLAPHFDESIAETTLAHLDRGMFEAQARDEAGWEDEFGHKDMWFAARDVAFENPDVEDMTEVMLFRLGVTRAPGAPLPDPDEVRRRQREQQVFSDLSLDVEALIQRMIGLLLIEISAAHLFTWAEELLSDPDLVAGDGAAARLVSFIRQDESPHVEYLRTALSEMRDRTFIGASGRRIAGADVIGTMWTRGITDSTGTRRAANQRLARIELEDAVAGHSRCDAIIAEYEGLATPEPETNGAFA